MIERIRQAAKGWLLTFGRRTGVVIAAMLMWAIFGVYTIMGWVVTPVLVLWYWITGSERAYSEVGRFGIGLDQCTNVIAFDGHQMETVSSHVGRRYVAAAVGKWNLTWKDRFVWWLTTKFEENHPIEAIDGNIDAAGVPL